MGFKLLGISIFAMLCLFGVSYFSFTKLTNLIEETSAQLSSVELQLQLKEQQVAALEEEVIILHKLETSDKARAARIERDLKEIQAATAGRLEALMKEVNLIEDIAERPTEVEAKIVTATSEVFQRINSASLDLSNSGAE